jgi:photosystem II stability/assembly factor-like uncharacterized protein
MTSAHMHAQWRPSGTAPYDSPQCIMEQGSNVFIGSSAGMFRSVDQGRSWVIVYNERQVTSMAANRRSLFTGTVKGLLVSKDFGQSWSPVDYPGANSWVWSLFANDSVVIASTRTGAFRSSDDGETWQQDTALSDVGFERISGRNGRICGILPLKWGSRYVRTLQMSTDNGRRWTSIAPTSSIIDVVVTDDAIMLCVDGSRTRLIISTDAGANWLESLSNRFQFDISSIAATANAMFVSNNKGDLCRSIDRGLTWNLVIDGSSLATTTSNSKVLAAERFVAMSSETDLPDRVLGSADEGGTWFDIFKGPLVNTVYAMTSYRDGIYVGTNAGMIYRTAAASSRWDVITMNDNALRISGLYVKGDTIVVSIYSNGVYRSLDNGIHWTKAVEGLKDPFIWKMASSDTVIYVSTKSDGVSRSTDYGDTWVASNSGLTKRDISSLAVDGSTVYAGSYEGGVFRSDNRGESWTSVSKGLEGAYIWSISARGNSVFVGSELGNVFRSRDRGDTWQNVGPGGPYSVLSMLAVGDTVVFGTENGRAFTSRNGGDSWTEQSSGLPVAAVHSLFSNRDMVYAGLESKGVFLLSLQEILTSVEENNADDIRIAHSGSPQPNPASEEVVVRFDGDEIGDEIPHVIVFDRLGHEWTSPSIGTTKDARGGVTIRWQCSEVPTGMYLLHMRSGHTHRVTKIHVVH